MIPHSNLVYALSQIDTFVDVSEEDLQRIYTLALAGAPPGHVDNEVNLLPLSQTQI